MQVVLTQDIPTLGAMGDVKEVKRGYGLNYLIPEGLALLAVNGNVVATAARTKKHLAAKAAGKDGDNAAVTAANGQTLEFTLKTEGETVFGSVSARDIATKLNLDAKLVTLESPIKTLGTTTVAIGHGEHTGKVTVNVTAA